MAATAMGNLPADQGKQSIVDDFMYGSNVATSHIYVRMGFLRKVYGILSVQLAVTAVIAGLIKMSTTLTTFVQTNQWMLMASFFVCLGLLIALNFKARETPTNFILLGIFTLVESYTIGVFVSFYDIQAVIEAVVLTAAVTVALTTYTLQSKRDFSSMGAGLFAVLWVLILAGFLQLFFQSPIFDRAICVGGALLFSLFIIFDTHMLMHKLSPEDYIHASIQLYLDILNLFIYILRIVGEARRN